MDRLRDLCRGRDTRAQDPGSPEPEARKRNVGGSTRRGTHGMTTEKATPKAEEAFPQASVKDLDSLTVDTSYQAEYATSSELQLEQAAFVEVIEDAGYEMRTYSGRGMYGRQCVSVALDRDTSIGMFVCDVLTQASFHREAEGAG